MLSVYIHHILHFFVMWQTIWSTKWSEMRSLSASCIAPRFGCKYDATLIAHVRWGDSIVVSCYFISCRLIHADMNMYLSMTTCKCARICFLLFFDSFSTSLASIAGGVIMKARLCTEYEINDYNSLAPRCDTFNAESKIACYMECVRHPLCFCKAFQFHSPDGFCEIFENDNCMSENKTPNITFVGVSQCKSNSPWLTTKPANGNWRWVTNPRKLRGAITLLSPDGNERIVGRVFHKGLFLPGFEIDSRLTTVGPLGNVIYCISNIQVLIFDSPAHFRWKNFYVGDPIPSRAIVGGYWIDGAPLYIVKTTQQPTDTIRAEIYNAKFRLVYPKRANRRPQMGILIAVQ